MPSILIVEDELIAAEYLKEILQANGFTILGIIDKGKEAMVEIPKLNPDIVLMDIMLKDNISGSEVALYLKQSAPNIAIVFLTAYADNEMVEYAIDANSYSYLMKPYNEQEIINTLKVVSARILNHNKNTTTQVKEAIQITESLTFNIKLQKLFKNDKEVELSKNALKFICLLCHQPNISISNEQISLHLWGELKNDVTLRTQIYRIRSIIGNDIIHNINGLGYMIKTKI